jgi:hypothetical protein
MCCRCLSIRELVKNLKLPTHDSTVTTVHKYINNFNSHLRILVTGWDYLDSVSWWRRLGACVGIISESVSSLPHCSSRSSLQTVTRDAQRPDKSILVFHLHHDLSLLSTIYCVDNHSSFITRVLGNRKKIYRVNFFCKASFSGLTNYVIRYIF